MLRIKNDALVRESGKYWYQDQLFDGLAYNVTDLNCNVIRIVGGEPAGNYASPYFTDVSSPAGIDFTGFTEDDIEVEGEISNGAGLSYARTMMGHKLSRNGQPYTGLAYAFFREFCIQEVGYKDGILISDAKWYHDGQLFELCLLSEVDECYVWNEDGTRKGAWISLVRVDADHCAERLLHLQLGFTSSGELRSLQAEGDIEAIETVVASHPYFPVRKLDELCDYTAAERFVFFDDAIPFALFEGMVNSNAFRSTVELHLPSKFLTMPEGIELVGRLRALRNVSLSSEAGNELTVAKKLKNRRPDIEVEVPRERADNPGYFDRVEVDQY